MRQTVTFLTQSKFFSPAFNAAIFDGPLRIYFAQYQESAALKLYFEIQEKLKDTYQQCRENFRQHGVHIFVMLYPTRETFELCFGRTEEAFATENLGDDIVVGVPETLSAEQHDGFMAKLNQVLKQAANLAPIPRPAEEAVL